jgi:hypothetical protein
VHLQAGSCQTAKGDDGVGVFNDEQARVLCKFLRSMAQRDEDIMCGDE